MKRDSTYGFTLIELVISTAILGILFVMISSVLENNGKQVRSVVYKAELLEETRVVGQMIADQVSRAVYIYPPGSSIQLNSTASWTVKNSLNSNTWVVGNSLNPILAYIEAPLNRAQSNACALATPENCLVFVAYYPLIRSVVVLNATGAENPGPDPDNLNARMIYEYRKVLSVGRLSSVVNTGLKEGTPSSILTELTNSSGQMVADYIRFDSLNVRPILGIESRVCRNFRGLYLKTDGSLAPTDENGLTDQTTLGCPLTVSTLNINAYLASVTTGVFTIQAEANLRQGKVTIPVITFPIAPRNLYQIGFNPNL